MDNKNSKEINIKELITPYLRNWKYFVGMFILMGVLAICYIKTKSQVYKAQTSVFIKDAKKMSMAAGDIGMLQGLSGLGGMGTNSIENEIGVFESKTITEDALKEHNFQTPLYAKQTFNNVELYGTTNPYIIRIIQEKKDVEFPEKSISINSKGNQLILSSEEWKEDIKTTFDKTISLPFALIMISKNPDFKAPKKVDMSNLFFNYVDFETTVNYFQENLLVDLLDKDGTIITLSVNFENKDKAKDFLNSLVRQYNIYAVNDKNIESKRTKDFIDKRITIISQELGDVETKKEGFKTSNDVIDLAVDTKLNIQLKEKSRAEILQLGTQLELNKILQNTLSRKQADQVLPLNIGLENEVAAKSIQEYNMLVLQRNKYLQEATPDNPIIKDLSKRIEEMKSSLSETLQKNVTSLELTKRSIESQLGSAENMIGKIPTYEKLFRGIERQQQIKESLYLLLLEKREEAAISMEITAEKARVIDKAFVFKKPVAPKKLVILGVFLLLGLLVPFLVIYIRQLMQTAVVTRVDLGKLTNVPVIAEIPKLKNKDNGLVLFNDVSPMAEAFRIFVTNLKFLLPPKEAPYTILVTSSVKGEGKTFVSTNLSIILASARDKVLIIGADVRNPQLQRYNPSMKSAKGLTEFLGGEDISLKDIIHPSGYNENCEFIYSGSIPPNPTDLLQNGKLDELLEMVKSLNKYRYIVLDTAPLLLVTDSFLIADKSDVIVYVTRSEVTERSYIEFLNNSIEDNKLKNVGIILNGVKESNFGYGNKFGYGYHADEKKWWQIFK
ncbi:GumC family protein [Chryseobacterium sp. 5_R23647]|uniref:GumC family protein n=1 Tax=Chryseobacterium sp. 5_R23647 TaxID=2258964 RepID=UPI000E26013A|nr:tyrosine-protein kinase [Chryseobacterium sp. 5_R23647]REC40407.1 capsular biosynthesis protein [Chryseobacterium sp. 5_R23647]